MIDDLEAFANAILRVLGANRSRFGLEPRAFPIYLNVYGFYPTGKELEERLEYLTMKGLAEEPPKTIGSTRAWKITDAGRRYLDEHNL